MTLPGGSRRLNCNAGNPEVSFVTVKARVVVARLPAKSLYDIADSPPLLFHPRQFTTTKENHHGKPKTRLRRLHYHREKRRC